MVAPLPAVVAAAEFAGPSGIVDPL